MHRVGYLHIESALLEIAELRPVIDPSPVLLRSAMEQDFSIADVLCDGAHHRLELGRGDRAVLVNRDAHVFHVPAFRNDLLSAQRNHRRDPSRVVGRKAFGVLDPANEQSRTKSGHGQSVLLVTALVTSTDSKRFLVLTVSAATEQEVGLVDSNVVDRL